MIHVQEALETLVFSEIKWKLLVLDTLKMRLRRYFNLYIKEKYIQVKPNKNNQFLCLKMKTC